MRILVTGACGFVGSTLIKSLLEDGRHPTIYGIDNFIRPGSELNRRELQGLGVKLSHADIRSASDFELIPRVDWVIDAAATPTVMAGVDGKTSSRQLIEHNLQGTVNILEYCKRNGSGFILLSTSRVYSIKQLKELPLIVRETAFQLKAKASLPRGLSPRGLQENFSMEPPLSLYGCSKAASEMLALEYGEAFGFPVYVDRCGVLGGAGQFSRPDQGIFSYWINAYLRRAPLAYIGFGGKGTQVRDCLHPRDLVSLLKAQMACTAKGMPRIFNIGGGTDHAMSLAQLSAWCEERFGRHTVARRPEPRPFDIPWVVMDSGLAKRTFGWRPQTPMTAILEEIAEHAREHPDWLKISASL